MPSMTDECTELLKQYEETNDCSIADHLMKYLDAARLQWWEETSSKIDFTHSSRKSWTLIHGLGEAQQQPKRSHALVRTNSIPAHLTLVGKASSHKGFKRKV